MKTFQAFAIVLLFSVSATAGILTYRTDTIGTEQIVEVSIANQSAYDTVNSTFPVASISISSDHEIFRGEPADYCVDLGTKIPFKRSDLEISGRKQKSALKRKIESKKESFYAALKDIQNGFSVSVDTAALKTEIQTLDQQYLELP